MKEYKDDKLVTSESFLSKLKTALKLVGELNQEAGHDVLYNMRFRDHIYTSLIKRSVDSSFQCFGRNGGADFSNDRTQLGEAKCTSVKRLKRKKGYSITGAFEFEKFDEPMRLNQALGYKSFLFCLFDKSDPFSLILGIYLNDDDSVSQFISILQKRAGEFLEEKRKWDLSGSAMKRDTARITIEDVLSVSGCKYFGSNGEVMNKAEALSILGIETISCDNNEFFT